MSPAPAPGTGPLEIRADPAGGADLAERADPAVRADPAAGADPAVRSDSAEGADPAVRVDPAAGADPLGRAGQAGQDARWRSFWPADRVRRPLDVARLSVAVTGLAGLVLLAVGAPDLTQSLAGLVPVVRSGVARGVLAVVNAAVSVAVFGVLAGILVDALRSRRFSLTCAALACAVGGAAGFGLGSLVTVVSGGAAMSLLAGPPEVSAGLPVTALVALLLGADLHGRRWWRAARVVTMAAIACALALGSLALPSAAYAVLVGSAAGFGVRVALGVARARPSDLVITAVLAAAGLDLTDLRLEYQVAGRARYAGVARGRGEVRVTVLDRDRGGVPAVRRTWRLLRLTTAVVGKPALTLRGQLERQALTAELARSAGVDAPEVLALLAAEPALLLAERALAGPTLESADVVDAAAGALPAFVALRRLHVAGLAHGNLSADGVVLLPGGRAGFADFAVAQPAATELQRALDLVTLLVVVAQRVGVPEAVAALREAYHLTGARESQLAALLQPVSLPRPVRRSVRRTPMLAELRTAIAGSADPAAAVGVPRMERLRPRTVVSVVGASVAAYLLATQLSKVNLAAALGSAQLGWLAVALVGSAVTYLGSAVALSAFVSIRLQLGRTALVQLASSFVALVTPPAVGHVGLNIRYLHKAGLPTSVAAADVAVKEVLTVAVTVPLLLVCGWLSGASGSRLTLLPSGTVLTILAVTAGILAVVAVLPPTRRLLRRRLEPLIRSTLPQLVATLSDPRRLIAAVSGVLVLNAGYVLALDASLRAFSSSLTLPTLVVVYLAASTLGSAAPTPGGLGAVEAALVGGLTASGVPVAAAVTAVLAFRAATFWLPAPIGWGAFVALQRTGRI